MAKNMQEGINLRSKSGYAKLIVKPYPAKKAKTIVNELLELAKSIQLMDDKLSNLVEGTCECEDCIAERRAQILEKGKIVVLKGGVGPMTLPDDVMVKVGKYQEFNKK